MQGFSTRTRLPTVQQTLLLYTEDKNKPKRGVWTAHRGNEHAVFISLVLSTTGGM